MTIEEAIKHCLEVAEQQEADSFIDRWSDDDEWSESLKENCRQCAADHRQLAEWLKELKELKNSIGAVKLNNMKEALELIRAYKAENAALREFNDKIYDVLSEQFGCPCTYSLIDEYMLENGGCDDCGGAIPDKECWNRYIQTKLIGGRTDEEP